MRKLIYIAAAALMCCAGCSKEKEDEPVDGGYSYMDMYVLKDGELIDGQDYVITFPQEGGEVDIEVVGRAFKMEFDNQRAFQIHYDGLSCYKIRKLGEELYENIPEDEFSSRYKGSFRITADPFLYTGTRESEFVITAYSGIDHAMKVIIRQDGFKD